jgi:hypothetical protein
MGHFTEKRLTEKLLTEMDFWNIFKLMSDEKFVPIIQIEIFQ